MVKNQWKIIFIHFLKEVKLPNLGKNSATKFCTNCPWSSKRHNHFEQLLKFRTTIGTTKFLSDLNPVTKNYCIVKDYCPVVEKIRNTKMIIWWRIRFCFGRCWKTFHSSSLSKTVDIILDCIYNEKLIINKNQAKYNEEASDNEETSKRLL